MALFLIVGKQQKTHKDTPIDRTVERFCDVDQLGAKGQIAAKTVCGFKTKIRQC